MCQLVHVCTTFILSLTIVFVVVVVVFFVDDFIDDFFELEITFFWDFVDDDCCELEKLSLFRGTDDCTSHSVSKTDTVPPAAACSNLDWLVIT